MKILFILFLFSIFCFSFSAQFEIAKPIIKIENDISAVRNEKLDINGSPCALIKVYSDIEGLIFEEKVTLEGAEYKGMGEYWVYLWDGSRKLTFKKNGYLPKTYEFPYKLEASTVYRLELSGIEEISITIQTDPSNAIVYFDGKEKGKIEQLKTSSGKHELKLVKEGYETKIVNIEVSTNKNFFKEKLKKLQLVEILISSMPEGAVVYIGETKLGTTPIPSFYPEGEYKIKLIHDGYDELDDTISIKAPKTEKSYNLTDVRAILTIKTFKKAKVFINDEHIAEYNEIKLPPKSYTVRVEINDLKPIIERFVLRKNEKKVLNMYPEMPTGNVVVSVNPENAKLELIDGDGEVYSPTNRNIFEEIPVGRYDLSITSSGYNEFIKKITVEEGKIIKEEGIRLQKKEQSKNKSKFINNDDMVLVKGGECRIEKSYIKLSDFYISKYEVTQKIYKEVMGKNPSRFLSDNNPVETVTWRDAIEFCNKLSELSGYEKCYKINESIFSTKIICDFNANGYRLPTESEWVFAASGGKETKNFQFSGSNDINEVAWYNDNSEEVHEVGARKANELGIYDMSGNVWEWCWDWYEGLYYADGQFGENLTGPTSGKRRVIRGGSWDYPAQHSLISFRYNYALSDYRYMGIRLVKTVN